MERREKGLNLTENSRTVLAKRYLKKDIKGNAIERPEDMFRRVARNIAQADRNYDKNANTKKTEDKFYDMMTKLEFLPNSPTLMNAGRELQQLSACFVLKIDDSMEDIFETLKACAMIHQSGGGTGMSFARLRPKGSMVKSTTGVASGPISFLKVFDSATEAVKQGGTRRGASMGILRVDHPDILEFIKCKEDDKAITNFNISVTVTEDFMRRVKNGEDYELKDPRDGRVTGKLNAKEVFDLIVTQAHKNGEPGIIFIDEMNKFNPTPKIGIYESTNPCVTGDTLISTEKGLMKIENLVTAFYKCKRTKIYTDDRAILENASEQAGSNTALMTRISTGVTSRNISNVWNVGKRYVFKLTTKAGYELTATANHKFLTKNGYVSLQNLKIGEEVLIQSAKGSFNSDKKIPFSRSNTVIGRNGRTYNFSFPSKWSKELGLVLGWLIGDGWIRDDKHCCVAFSFGKKDREAVKFIRSFMDNTAQYKMKGAKREWEVFHLSYGSRHMVDFFKSLGVKVVDSQDKEVPEALFQAPIEAVIGFMQGLFSADGNVRDNPKSNSSWIALSSKSKKLLQQTQLLLLNLGIKSTLLNRSRPSRSGMFPYINKEGERKTYISDGILYELGIFGASRERFRKEIGFVVKYKQIQLDSVRFKGFRKEKFFDKVISIDEVGMRHVYDLTEPATHSMIANGLVVHQCGEQILLPFESCNLSSINLSKMLVEKDGKTKIDWEKIRTAACGAVHFLDNVIDMNKYPIRQIERMTKGNRKVGLGVMGWADMLIQLGIPYNSEEAVGLAEKVMKFIQEAAVKKSQEMAEKRGTFPNFKDSVFVGGKKIRNATMTTIAPTGTLSIIAGCSSGIEPLFAVCFYRKVLDGAKLVDVNPHFEKIAKKRGFYSKELMEKISGQASIQDIEEIPEDVRKIFVTSHDISPIWHIKTQAAFQRYTNNAVSKTVNFSNDATPQEVREVYMLAHQLGCKGVTIYRDGSRQEQVLNIDRKAPGAEEKKQRESEKAMEKKQKIEKKVEKALEQIQTTGDKIAPRARPRVVTGTTTKVQTGCGNLYVTINVDEGGRPFEVFTQMGKAGGCAASQLEAVGRLVSLALRSDVDVKSIIEQLQGIRCPSPSWEKTGRIFSCADAIAKVVERRLIGEAKGEEGEEVFDSPMAHTKGTQDPNETSSKAGNIMIHRIESTKKRTVVGVCPDCSGALVHEEGCMKCHGCGYTKC